MHLKYILYGLIIITQASYAYARPMSDPEQEMCWAIGSGDAMCLDNSGGGGSNNGMSYDTSADSFMHREPLRNALNQGFIGGAAGAATGGAIGLVVGVAAGVSSSCVSCHSGK